MARFALIERGVVKDIFDKDPRLPAKITVPVAIPDGKNDDGSPRFRHEMQDQEVPGWSSDFDIREIGKKVQSGWVIGEDDELEPPTPATVPAADLPDVLIRVAEQEPINVSGVSVSLADLEGLRNARDYLTMSASPPPSVQWRSGGRSTPLTLADVEAAILALVTRQQRLYDKYAEVAGPIESGEITDRDIVKAFANI